MKKSNGKITALSKKRSGKLKAVRSNYRSEKDLLANKQFFHEEVQRQIDAHREEPGFFYPFYVFERQHI